VEFYLPGDEKGTGIKTHASICTCCVPHTYIYNMYIYTLYVWRLKIYIVLFVKVFDCSISSSLPRQLHLVILLEYIVWYYITFIYNRNFKYKPHVLKGMALYCIIKIIYPPFFEGKNCMHSTQQNFLKCSNCTEHILLPRESFCNRTLYTFALTLPVNYISSYSNLFSEPHLSTHKSIQGLTYLTMLSSQHGMCIHYCI